MITAAAAAEPAKPTRARLGASRRSGREHAIWNASAGATKIRFRIELAAKRTNPAATSAGVRLLGLAALDQVHTATAAPITTNAAAAAELVTGCHSVDASLSAGLRKLRMYVQMSVPSGVANVAAIAARTPAPARTAMWAPGTLDRPRRPSIHS